MHNRSPSSQVAFVCNSVSKRCVYVQKSECFKKYYCLAQMESDQEKLKGGHGFKKELTRLSSSTSV